MNRIEDPHHHDGRNGGTVDKMCRDRVIGQLADEVLEVWVARDHERRDRDPLAAADGPIDYELAGDEELARARAVDDSRSKRIAHSRSIRGCSLSGTWRISITAGAGPFPVTSTFPFPSLNPCPFPCPAGRNEERGTGRWRVTGAGRGTGFLLAAANLERRR